MLLVLLDFVSSIFAHFCDVIIKRLVSRNFLLMNEVIYRKNIQFQF